jgi:hypothetical protein
VVPLVKNSEHFSISARAIPGGAYAPPEPLREGSLLKISVIYFLAALYYEERNECACCYEDKSYVRKIVHKNTCDSGVLSGRVFV